MKPKIKSITVEHEKGISVIKAEDLCELEDVFNEIINEYESIFLQRFKNGLDHQDTGEK